MRAGDVQFNSPVLNWPNLNCAMLRLQLVIRPYKQRACRRCPMDGAASCALHAQPPVQPHLQLRGHLGFPSASFLPHPAACQRPQLSGLGFLFRLFIIVPTCMYAYNTMTYVALLSALLKFSKNDQFLSLFLIQLLQQNYAI